MIHLEKVSVQYGDFTALHPASLSFGEGQFIVLLGASGAGKSTLLRSMNMLAPHSAGSVRVDGIGVLDCGQKLRLHRQRTGMIFQQHQLIGRQNALENVMLGRIGYHPAWRTLFPLARQERRLALNCLERVGLLHKAFERVDRLSGGQQQRVGIARALAQQPKLMLADEPVASLDPATSRQVMSQLKQFCMEDGITIVVSLHQVDLAREYADRIIGMAQGRVLFDLPPQELTPSLAHTLYTQGAQIRATTADYGARDFNDLAFPLPIAPSKELS